MSEDEKQPEPEPGLVPEVLDAVNKGRAARGLPPLTRGPGFREKLWDEEKGDTYDGPDS
jgi:hypothetical protein